MVLEMSDWAGGMLFGLFLLLFFLVKGVSGSPSFLNSLVTDKKLPRRSARVSKPRPASSLTASMRSALPADISKTSKEENPIRLSALIMIRAQPGRVLFSRCSSKMFLSKATLELWCLEVRHGIASPALLCGRYLLLPLMIFLLWANLSRETVPSQTSDMGKKAVSVLAHSFFLP